MPMTTTQDSIAAGVGLLRKSMSAIVIALFVVMMGAVLLQVCGRYVFNYSIAVASEVATYSQIWMVMLGAGIAMARHQHVAITLFHGHLSPPLARAVSIAIAAITIAFLGVIGYGSIPLVKLGFMQTSAAMDMPMWIMYVSMPIGAAYIALELVVSVIQRWDDPFAQPTAEMEEDAA